MKQYEFFNDQCCIYIIEQHGQPLVIGITGNLHKRMEAYAVKKNQKLIFLRYFSDTLSALAFKLLLQNLSDGTVERLIRRTNPTKKDLSKEICISK